MPKYSPGLKAKLDLVTIKVDWANIHKTELGNARRVRCWRDSNVDAESPATTGVEFLNVGNTGALLLTAGNITDLGILTGVTVKQPADLSTGASVLRIEGNGEWVEYSLGLMGSGKEFMLPANPTGTANTGFAFAPGSGTKAPVLYDSGTGPLSPVLTANVPHSVDVEDWSTGAKGTTTRLFFDNRIINWIFDDTDVSSNMGDVRVYQSTATATLGGTEFGVTLFAMTGQANSESSEPVYQVIVGKSLINGNWDDYPAFSGYIMGVTDTFAPPHKVTIRKQDGGVLHVHQMRDGLPMNSPELHDNHIKNEVDDFPIRPHTHSAQMLAWQSNRPKINSFKSKLMPGFKSDAYRATVCRSHYSSNLANPLTNGPQNMNSHGQWFVMPKWALASKHQNLDTANLDPYSYNIDNVYIGFGYGTATGGNVRMTGWGNEPAAPGGMDQICGPGGPRHDRMVVPTPQAIDLSDPNYVRPRGGEPIREMVDAWNLNTFNFPHFLITDAKTFSTIPIQEVVGQGLWGHGKTYYAPNDYYVSGGMAKTVPAFAWDHGMGAVEGEIYDGAFVDKNGRQPWNGAAIDYLHNWNSDALTAILYNSPMHAYAGKHRLIASILCQLGGNGAESPVSNMQDAWFLTRRHAARYLHLVASWKIRSDHPYGISGKMVEDRMQRELEAIYDHVYLPTMVTNSQTPYFKAIRNVGVPMIQSYGFDSWQVSSGGLTYYMAGVLQLMRQFGLWKVMMEKSDKCNKALRFIIRTLDLASVDFVLDTDHRFEDYQVLKGANGPNPEIVASWADWNTTFPKTHPDQCLIKDRNGIQYGKAGATWPDGTSATASREQNLSQHYRYQYLCVRRDYFPDIPCERGPTAIADAIAKYDGWYGLIESQVTANPSRDNDWVWRWPGMAIINPPSVLAP